MAVVAKVRRQAAQTATRVCPEAVYRSLRIKKAFTPLNLHVSDVS